MKKRVSKLDPHDPAFDPLDEEVDMSGAVPGRFSGRFKDVVVSVVLEPDIAAKIKSDKEVTRVLREYIRNKAARRRATKPRRPARARAGR
jgi:hypothetical protein